MSPEQMAGWFFTAKGGASNQASDALSHCLAILRSPPPGSTRSQIVAGLKQGLSDVLADMDCRTAEERAAIDAALARKGLPSIAKMTLAVKKKHRRVLARGHIKSDEEFHLVAEILADVDLVISDSDRAKLGQMSYAYESRAK